jgi:amino acid adenylation domain-containing protein
MISSTTQSSSVPQQDFHSASAETPLSVFESFVRIQPQSPAVSCAGTQLSYAELNASANRLAHHLLGLNLPRHSIVAIWLDRSIEAVVAMIAILKAGHTYLPLDATYPAARVAQTLEDAAPAALISEQSLAATLPGLSPRLVTFEDILHNNVTNPVAIAPAEAAYVIYTSGSTGRPKGVLVSQHNLLRLVAQTLDRFHFRPADIWTVFHSIAFDFSVWEIWGPLLTGASLVVVPYETTRSPEDFYRLLSSERITVLNQTPSAFALLSQVEERGLTLPLALRLVIFGGEALNFASLRPWFRRHRDSHPRLINCYGITETTVHVTIREVSQADAELERESLLGDPIPDLQIHLLDPAGHPVADGEIGEICIAGAGVSLGYLNRPELTAERYTLVTNSQQPITNNRLYHSGDLARRRADGELVFLGRRDQQVKISGFRIELGEVEAAISEFSGVAQVCVTPFTDDSGHTQLAAYLVEDAQLTLPDLARNLSRCLPAHMLPAAYLRIHSIPLTANGKVDRAALPKPSPESFASLLNGSSPRPAASPTEEAVLALVQDLVGPEIGLDDNFFMVGGHSLLGTRFVLRAREAFDVKVTLRDIFEAENIAEIAQKIEQLIIADIEALSEEEAERYSPSGRVA